MERVGTKTPTELIVGWEKKEKNVGKHRLQLGKPVICLSLKTDENQKKKQIKMLCCTWALCATVQKEKV